MIGSCVEISGPRMRAWVQIPLLTKTFLFWLSVHYYLSAVSSKSHEVAWPSGLRRWFKAPVSSGAWVRIPPLPTIFFSSDFWNIMINFKLWLYNDYIHETTLLLYILVGENEFYLRKKETIVRWTLNKIPCSLKQAHFLTTKDNLAR